MRIKMWDSDGKEYKELPDFEFVRIGKQLQEGYVEGEIFFIDKGKEIKGWWKK